MFDTGYPTLKVTRQNKYNLKYGMHLCLCVHNINFWEGKILERLKITCLSVFIVYSIISAKSTDFTENMINENFILYHDSDK